MSWFLPHSISQAKLDQEKEEDRMLIEATALETTVTTLQCFVGTALFSKMLDRYVEAEDDKIQLCWCSNCHNNCDVGWDGETTENGRCRDCVMTCIISIRICSSSSRLASPCVSYHNTHCRPTIIYSSHANTACLLVNDHHGLLSFVSVSSLFETLCCSCVSSGFSTIHVFSKEASLPVTLYTL